MSGCKLYVQSHESWTVFFQRWSSEQMSGNVTFLIWSCFYNGRRRAEKFWGQLDVWVACSGKHPRIWHRSTYSALTTPTFGVQSHWKHKPGTSILHPFWLVNGWKWRYHQPLVQMTPILLQWCLFITRTPKHFKSPNLGQWVIWVLAVKSRITPQAIRRACRSLHFLRSSVARRSCQGLSFGAELEKCKLRHAYSIHILKTPLLGLSDDHLCNFSRALNLQVTVCLVYTTYYIICYKGALHAAHVQEHMKLELQT